jgi:hypothetical protein
MTRRPVRYWFACPRCDARTWSEIPTARFAHHCAGRGPEIEWRAIDLPETGFRPADGPTGANQKADA